MRFVSIFILLFTSLFVMQAQAADSRTTSPAEQVLPNDRAELEKRLSVYEKAAQQQDVRVVWQFVNELLYTNKELRSLFIEKSGEYFDAEMLRLVSLQLRFNVAAEIQLPYLLTAYPPSTHEAMSELGMIVGLLEEKIERYQGNEPKFGYSLLSQVYEFILFNWFPGKYLNEAEDSKTPVLGVLLDLPELVVNGLPETDSAQLFRVGDTLIEIDGQKVNSFPQVRAALYSARAKQNITIKVLRESKLTTVSLTNPNKLDPLASTHRFEILKGQVNPIEKFKKASFQNDLAGFQLGAAAFFKCLGAESDTESIMACRYHLRIVHEGKSQAGKSDASMAFFELLASLPMYILEAELTQLELIKRIAKQSSKTDLAALDESLEAFRTWTTFRPEFAFNTAIVLWNAGYRDRALSFFLDLHEKMIAQVMLNPDQSPKLIFYSASELAWRQMQDSSDPETTSAAERILKFLALAPLSEEDLAEKQKILYRANLNLLLADFRENGTFESDESQDLQGRLALLSDQDIELLKDIIRFENGAMEDYEIPKYYLDLSNALHTQKEDKMRAKIAVALSMVNLAEHEPGEVCKLYQEASEEGAHEAKLLSFLYGKCDLNIAGASKELRNLGGKGFSYAYFLLAQEEYQRERYSEAAKWLRLALGLATSDAELKGTTLGFEREFRNVLLEQANETREFLAHLDSLATKTKKKAHQSSASVSKASSSKTRKKPVKSSSLASGLGNFLGAFLAAALSEAISHELGIYDQPVKRGRTNSGRAFHSSQSRIETISSREGPIFINKSAGTSFVTSPNRANATIQKSGNTSWARYRDQTTSYQRIGDTVYGSNGSTIQKIGGSTYIRDRSGNQKVCNKIGSSVFCY